MIISKTWGSTPSFIRSFNTSVQRLSTYGITREFTDFDIRVKSNHKFTEVKFLKTNEVYNLSNAFLRDSSQGPLSIEPSSGQKLFTTASIIDEIPKRIEIPNDESFSISWSDGEKSTYTKKFLEKYAWEIYPGRYFTNEVTHWDQSNKEKFPHLPNYDYNAYLNDEKVLADVLNDLNKFGIAIVNNIPSKPDEEHDSQPIVKQLGERIGYIKETFYGTVFDVRTKPEAKNIADTDKFLPLHQDLLYYESPPGLQLLHFIKNRSTGGENVFADGFSAAEYVKKVDLEAYQALLTCPTNFHYNRGGHQYYQSRYLVVEDNTQHTLGGGNTVYKEVNYSPPFQAPFEYGVATTLNFEKNPEVVQQRKTFEAFLRGFKLFEDYINDPNNKLKFKTEEGTCILFDNRRVFHAREAFDAKSGERWLKGCYIDKDAYQSKLRVTKS